MSKLKATPQKNKHSKKEKTSKYNKHENENFEYNLKQNHNKKLHQQKHSKQDVSADSKNRSKKSQEVNDSNNNDDWISNLVKETTTFKPSTTKEERIQKRLHQKQRREEAKKMKQKQRQNHEYNKINKRTIVEANNDYNNIPLKLSKSSYSNLSNLNQHLSSITVTLHNKINENKVKPKLYKPSKEPKGKATKNSSYQNTAKGIQQIQPRNNDYNGLGLAKPSLYLHFHDVSFRAKYIDEFYDHVDGFNGKFHKSYSYKDDGLDGTMLWKKLLLEKKKQSNESA